MAKLIGTDTADTGTGQVANRVVYSKNVCSADGTVTELRLYSPLAGNAKIALYSDNGAGNAPGSLLASGELACTGGQWNSVTGLSIAVTSGTIYWLGIIVDTQGTRAVYPDAGNTGRKYRSLAYSTFTYPETYNNVGFSDAPGFTDCLSAYSADGTVLLTRNLLGAGI
jgi:hypothetical protein